MPRPTLADVASRAFVSVSTASAALSGRGAVSAATRELVLRAAEELGYRPDALARGLRAGREPIVGLVVDRALYEGRADSAQVFVRGLLHGLDEELLARGAAADLGGESARPPVDAVLDVSAGARLRHLQAFRDA